MRRSVLSVAVAVGIIVPSAAAAEPVLMISIDGLRPADVIEAQRRGLAIPNLRRFVLEGSYATSVTGVLPSVTYPSHTTLITGASPARHGVVSNNTFDPLQINQGGWYWYASDIRVPTLWSAAAAGGKSVANVHWPVSVGASGVTWNLPQVWRTGHGDDAKLVAALSTPGLVAELEQATGEAYASGIAEDIESDENRGRFAARLIAAHKPDFATVYLTSLDHQQHIDGPDSPQAKAVLERVDAIVGKLVDAELAAHPDAVIAVVSDHGFAPITREFNLFAAFIAEGLIKLDASSKIESWDAMPWPSGGSIAVVLQRPDDRMLQARLRSLLDRLQSDRANGIAAIADRTQIDAMRGNPQASFFIDLAPGTTAAAFSGANTALIGTPRYHGMHGYFPSSPAMASTFLIMGHGIPKGRSLGTIDMRSIAPTLAHVMSAALDGAELPALSLDQ